MTLSWPGIQQAVFVTIPRRSGPEFRTLRNSADGSRPVWVAILCGGPGGTVGS